MGPRIIELEVEPMDLVGEERRKISRLIDRFVLFNWVVG